MNLKEKIENRLSDLQSKLENNDHLNNADQVIDLINSISKFWSVLREEDKDYIQAARYATENRMEWK